MKSYKSHATMLVHNAMVLSAMTFIIVHTGSLWPLVLVLGIAGVKGDKEEDKL